MLYPAKKNVGFTLVELLIALAIFSIVMSIVIAGLGALIKGNDILVKKTNEFTEIQKSAQLIEQDLSQIIHRPIKNYDGSRLDSIVLKENAYVEFTREGMVRPYEKQSHLQRVAYEYDGNNLYRIKWPVLDRVNNTKSQKYLLFSNVKHFSMRFYDEKMRKINFNNKPLSWPRLVMIRVIMRPNILFTRIFAIDTNRELGNE